jgi:hypothetical protein
MKYGKSVEQKRTEDTLKKLTSENERLEKLKATMEEELKTREADVDKRERDSLLMAEQNRQIQEELEIRRRQVDADLEALMAEKKEAADVWKQIEMESHKAVDIEEIINERVNKLVENEKASITREMTRLKKLEKDVAAAEKELTKKEKGHKADRGKIEAQEAELKRKEEELIKKEKMMEERKEYLDKLKESLTKIL